MWRVFLVLAGVIVSTASMAGQETAAATLHSIERERQLGSVLARDIEAHAKLIHDPLIREYVSGLAQNIVQHSDARLALTVKVIDSDEINAFLLPGGYLYVNSGATSENGTGAQPLVFCK
jgi:beta-barrel assembly-enhancing protease